MKKIVSILLALCLLAGGTGTVSAAAQSPNYGVNVYVNQAPLSGDVNPQLIGSTTYVPLRAFCERMADCTVTWNAESRLASVVSSSVEIQVYADSRYLTINDRCFYMPQGAQIVAGRLMVPVRLLAKAYGAEVSWDQASWSVWVSAAGQPLTSGSGVYRSDEVYWLSRIISAESEAESLEGKMAVGNVVLNRVPSPDYPDCIYDVIFDTNYGTQFTPAANGTIHNMPDAESVVAAKLCLEGYRVVGSSLYFFNSQKSPGDWIVSHCDYVATIGNHSFYV
jgi:N-acetylmuramoyl-L-alanine amidase